MKYIVSDEMRTQLKASFPASAVSKDTSRGFELTSIKAAYIVERLNDVFGLCGLGWRYVHSPFVDVGKEVTTEVAIQYRVTDDPLAGCPPITWYEHGWASRTDGGWDLAGSATNNWWWSEPIFAAGGNHAGSGSVPNTDARKSAVTDGLTKAASMIGVGHEAFKGLLGGSRQQSSQAPRQARQATQQAPPQAQATATPSNGSVRPLTPTKLKGIIVDKIVSHGGREVGASSAQVRMLMALFSQVSKKDETRHCVFEYLTGKASTGDMSVADTSALIDWLAGEGNDVHKDAAAEARLIIAEPRQVVVTSAPEEGFTNKEIQDMIYKGSEQIDL
ncbi:MAG TPA: hypothetical protein VM537_23850 [Anaerolineae bacterium]|nr:hypothetical protein [Anaerolineae bacterium]